MDDRRVRRREHTMAEETEGAPAPAPKKKLNIKMLIIIGGSVLVFGIGAFSGYKLWIGKKAAGGEGGDKTAVEETKSGDKDGKVQSIIPLEPFVVNLSAPGRYLKATMHLELKNPAEVEVVNQHMAMIRDVIITVLSSKSSDAVSGPEGKFQLKDELLFRVNQALGGEAVKNIYFTEFVMQ